MSMKSGFKHNRYNPLTISVTDKEYLGSSSVHHEFLVKFEKDLNKIVKKIKNINKYNV